MKKILLTTLLLILALMLFAEQYFVNDNQNEVNLISTGPQQNVLEMTLGHFNREAVRIDGNLYWNLELKKEGFTQERGMPQLPYVTRSLIIPGTARMQVNVIASEFTDIQMSVAPSKGIITRDINPETVPWTFDTFYQGDGYYPTQLADLSEPFIIRDYRGITVYFRPFVYYPSTQTLRVYTRIRLSVDNAGLDTVNLMTAAKNSASVWFDGIYKSLFLNYDQAKYPDLDEEGRMLIITNSMFNTVLQPYVDWKRQKGFTVNVVDITTAGPTASQLQTYIQNQYNQNNDLAFVQIIGDAAQVPTLTSGGGGSDPSFSLVAGGDSYPDLFVGRFSAQTTTELETQITRTIYYERDMPADSPWLATAVGIASAQGGGSQGDMGESDAVHMDNIRTDLLNYGYTTVNQIYDTNGGTAAMVSTAVNAGRGFINYCGHGADTYWVTTGFSNTNVNQLTNDNKLPFIVSVACVNGNFTNQTCFAEAWLRARDSVTGNPRGAMAFYGSTINQSWNSPMRAQDEITDLLVANAKTTIGGLYFNGASEMIEVYGTDGINMFKTWHIFGDASLQVRTVSPQPVTATYNNVLFLGMDTFNVQTYPDARVTLYADGTLYGSAIADASGNAQITLNVIPTEPIDLTLTITGFDRLTYIDTIEVVPSQGPYIQVDNCTVSDDNNQADYGETTYFDLTLNNVGSEPANNIAATISSTDTYITILDTTENFGNIPAGQAVTSTDGYMIQVADNVPDQHIAIIHVVITQDGTLAWEYNVNLILNAPVFSVGAVTVDDSQGNDNGRIDAGEMVILSFPVTNIGHSDASDMLFSLVVNSPINYLLNPVLTNFPLVPVDGTAQAMFELAFSSQIDPGTVAHLMLMGISGDYSIIQNVDFYIGLLMESFDSGSFTSYPWTFTGGDWTLDTTTYHSPGASARSATITHSQTTSMSVTMDSPQAGSISFWKKVSSEASYDYLKFYINGVLKNSWSGEIDWSQETFAVAAGTNIYRWDYIKDYMVSSGSDCAWIDDITFPSSGGPTGTPSISLSDTALDFGSHIAADFTAMPFSITNTGDAAMLGTITGTSIFKVKQSQDTDYAQTINYLVPAGLTLNFEVMIFPPQDGTYNAALSITSDDPDNALSYINVSAVVLPTAADDTHTTLVTALRGNYPNPFNPETTVSFSLKNDSRVTVEIYNILGQKVKTLVNSNLKAGNYNYKWNGKTDAGHSAGSGIYFCRMKAGNYESTAKMVMMK